MASLLWPDEIERLSRFRSAVQVLAVRQAARVKAHKPLAWLQVEPAGPGSRVEIRLHTFGWEDLEDRTVRKLAEAPADLAALQGTS